MKILFPSLNFDQEDHIWKLAAMPNWLYIDTVDKDNITVLRIDEESREFVQTVF